MNPFIKLKAFLAYTKAVEQADKAYSENPTRYYVMPTEDGHLMVMNRYTFKELKKKHYMRKDCHVQDLLRECFYHTPLQNGSGAMCPEDRELGKRQCYAWFAMASKVERIKRMQECRRH